MNNAGTSHLAYCADFEAVKQRLTVLLERQGTDRVFAVMDTPSAALDEFAAKYAEGYCDCPDLGERVAFWEAHLRRKARVFDDSVPSAYLSECDQGLYGGMLGGKVQYMAHPENGWISSMVAPLVEDWAGFDALAIDAEASIFKRFRRQLDVYLAAAAGRFGVSHFILIDGLNFLFELFGATRTYLETIENPDLVGRAIDFAYDLNVAVQEAFFGAGVMVEGGTCSNMVQWAPGRVVSESIDPFHMTSVDDFERWGRAPFERILAHFDGGVVHIHGNGRHLLEAAASIRGLKALWLGDDRGYPRAFEVLPALRARVGDLPLVCHCGYGEFVAALEKHSLVGGVLYHVGGAPDTDAANRTMDAVREYS